MSSVAYGDEAMFIQCFAMNYIGYLMPIKEIIYFKIGVIFFKAMNGLAPSYLAEMFIAVSSDPAHRQNRSADQRDLIIQRVKNMSYRRQRFAIADPSFWSSISMDLHSNSSLIVFKRNLKTYSEQLLMLCHRSALKLDLGVHLPTYTIMLVYDYAPVSRVRI